MSTPGIKDPTRARPRRPVLACFAALVVALSSASSAGAAPDPRPPATDGDYPSAPEVLSPAAGTWMRVWEGTCNAVRVSPSTDSSGIDGYWVGIDGDPLDDGVRIGISAPGWDEVCLPAGGWTEGPHTLTVRAKDRAGNFSAPTVLEVEFDTAPSAYPQDVTVTATPGSRVVDVRWTQASDPASPTVDYLVEYGYGHSLVTTSDHVTVSLPDEPGTTRPTFINMIGVSARDEHGFTSLTRSSAFFVDLTRPAAPKLLQPASGTWTACKPMTISGLSAGDDEAGTGNQDILVDGVPAMAFPRPPNAFLRVGPPIPISTTSTWYLQGAISPGHPLGYCSLAEGKHTLTVVAEAEAWGRLTGSSLTVGIDVTPPVSGTVAAVAGTPWAGPLTLSWTRPTDAFSGVRTQQLLMDGKAVASLAATVTSVRVVVPPGTHSFRVRTTDTVGLSADGPVRQVTTKALTAPTAPRVTAPTASSTTSRTVGVRWTASAPSWGATLTKYELIVDGKVRATVSGTTLTTKVTVSKGSHRVQVRATDSARKSTLGAAVAFKAK
ncbi:MAG: hypothetical protein U0Q15_01915 [Kineosporiaceae bacterium]